MSTDPKISTLLDQYYEAMHDSRTADEYHRRHGLQSACILTVTDDERADAIAEWLEPRIRGKIVVEIGAGIGLLACYMAQYAKKVYAIELDPAWTSIFVWQLYAKKPPNLTFIFGKAEDAPPIAADVALFCTHSGHAAMWVAASRFAPTVIDVYTEILPPGAHARAFDEAFAAATTEQAPLNESVSRSLPDTPRE